MRMLVLGGGRFVGPALVDVGVGRGWQVTVLNRGLTATDVPAGVEQLRADRRDADQLASVLTDRTWDLAVDTWSDAPVIATRTAAALAGRVGRLAYVSSKSVYVWGEHRDESSPVVDGDPEAESGTYPALKRGAELGVLRAFPDALLVRAGLILGPREDVGRLPWWLTRIARGGRVVAPGRPDRPLQYIDVRDLAQWTVDAAERGVSGPVDVAGPSGHATTEQLLSTCRTVTGSDARFVWVDEQTLAQAGVQPWTHLPCWVPEDEEFAGYLEADTSRAAGLGLTCRPVLDTVRDTWAWLAVHGVPPVRTDRPANGLPDDVEARLLSAVG